MRPSELPLSALAPHLPLFINSLLGPFKMLYPLGHETRRQVSVGRGVCSVRTDAELYLVLSPALPGLLFPGDLRLAASKRQ